MKRLDAERGGDAHDTPAAPKTPKTPKTPNKRAAMTTDGNGSNKKPRSAKQAAKVKVEEETDEPAATTVKEETGYGNATNGENGENGEGSDGGISA